MNLPVREDLFLQSNANDLNDAELITLHAQQFVGAFPPETGLGVNFDLSKVRSAELYRIGQRTSMGSATITVARDAKGKVLGKFLGGFLVMPCL